MAQPKTRIRRILFSRSVAVLFGIQVGLYLSEDAALGLGLDTVAEYFEIVVGVGSSVLRTLSQTVGDLTGWYLGTGWQSADVLLGFLIVFGVYYLIAVIAAVPVRIIYGAGQKRMSG